MQYGRDTAVWLARSDKARQHTYGLHRERHHWHTYKGYQCSIHLSNSGQSRGRTFLSSTRAHRISTACYRVTAHREARMAAQAQQRHSTAEPPVCQRLSALHVAASTFSKHPKRCVSLPSALGQCRRRPSNVR